MENTCKTTITPKPKTYWIAVLSVVVFVGVCITSMLGKTSILRLILALVFVGGSLPPALLKIEFNDESIIIRKLLRKRTFPFKRIKSAILASRKSGTTSTVQILTIVSSNTDVEFALPSRSELKKNAIIISSSAFAFSDWEKILTFFQLKIYKLPDDPLEIKKWYEGLKP
jgi:uncharacterized membrane-anchored protein